MTCAMILCDNCALQYDEALELCPGDKCGTPNPKRAPNPGLGWPPGSGGAPHVVAEIGRGASRTGAVQMAGSGYHGSGDFAPASPHGANASAVDVVGVRPKSPLIVAFVALAALLVTAGGWYLLARAGGERPPDGMVYVEGGRYVIGRNDGDEYDRPAHEAVVRAFYIDKAEVTCGQYQEFVDATGRRPPASWRDGRHPPSAANLPVTGVTWDDASAYAEWAGKRLPTEEEWESAARGAEGRLYPWGNAWEEGLANASDGAGGLAEVMTSKGATPSGVHDLIGNAWEWTSSDLRPYPGGRLPDDVPPGELKVIRGGSWKEGRKVTATYRAYLLPRDEADYSATGFRCARDAGRER